MTNYSVVYLTKEKSGEYTLWNNEPQRTSSGWVDSHGHHPLQGDTMSLVNAQVYDAMKVTPDDQKATPSIIIPIAYLTNLNGNKDYSGDELNFEYSESASAIIEKLMEALTEPIAEVLKIRSKMSELHTKIFNATSKVSAVLDGISGVHEDMERRSERIKLAYDDARNIENIANSNAKRKKSNEKGGDEEQKSSEPFMFSDEMVAINTCRMKLDESIEILSKQVNLFDTKVKDGVDRALDLQKELFSQGKQLDKLYDKITKIVNSTRKDFSSRKAGEEVIKLFSRIEMLNGRVNNERQRNAQLFQENNRLSGRYDDLLVETQALRVGLSEWLKEQQPDVYDAIVKYTNQKSIVIDNMTEEKRSKVIIASVKKLQSDVKDLQKKTYIKDNELTEIQGLVNQLNKLVYKTREAVRKRAKEACQLAKMQPITDPEDVVEAIKQQQGMVEFVTEDEATEEPHNQHKEEEQV